MQPDTFDYSAYELQAIAQLNQLNASVDAMFGMRHVPPAGDVFLIGLEPDGVLVDLAPTQEHYSHGDDSDAGFDYASYEAQAIADLTALQASIDSMFAPQPDVLVV